MDVIFTMNLHFKSIQDVPYRTFDLLNMVVKPIPAKQPMNGGAHKSDFGTKEKFCKCCHDLKVITEFPYAIKKDGTIRTERRGICCLDCHKTEKGRKMETYRVRA